MNYSIIVSPKTNKSVLINSSLGKNILKQYLKALIGGTAVMAYALKEGFRLENEGNEEAAAKKFIEVLVDDPSGMSLSKDQENSQLLNMLIDTWPEYEQRIREYLKENGITDEEAKRNTDGNNNWLNIMVKVKMLNEIKDILDSMPKNYIFKENITNKIQYTEGGKEKKKNN